MDDRAKALLRSIGLLDGNPKSPEDSPSEDLFPSLDDSVLLKILRHLDLASLMRVRKLSSRFLRVSSDETLYKRITWAKHSVITDDVPMGVSEGVAANHIKLVMLCNDVSLRGLIPAELAKGFGFFHSKPPSAFSPVAVTPEGLGSAWKDNLLHLPLRVDYNGQPFGRPLAGEDATFSLARLVAHAAKTRPLVAGTIVGSGTVSNKDEDGGPGRPVADGGRGYACIAEIRMIETIRDGQPATPFMADGDTVRIDMHDRDGHSIFGAIEQTVTAL
ncbi:MAG: fumarylacetoacetate hydrolase family protein [Pseudomonadota bacterium]